MNTQFSSLRATKCVCALFFLPNLIWAADRGEVVSDRADPVMSRFVQLVVDTNPQMQAAREKVNAQASRRDAAARPMYNPELSIDAENADIDTRSIGLSQSFDWGRKRDARTKVFESDRLVAEAEYSILKQSVIDDLLNGLAFHQLELRRIELASSRDELMTKFVNQAQRRFDIGDLTQSELDQAKLSAINAKIRSATAGASLAEARQSVRSLLGQDTQQKWPELPQRIPEISSDLKNEDLKMRLMALPEVVLAQREVDMSNDLIELRRREKKPDPTISLSAGTVSDGERDDDLIGLSLSIPLYVRNRFDHEVATARAERNRVVQLYNDTLRRAETRLTSAQERYRITQSAWDNWTSVGKNSLNLQIEQLQKLWDAGELSTTDYLLRLGQTIEIQESALILENTQWRAWFEWLSASGLTNTWLRLEKQQ